MNEAQQLLEAAFDGSLDMNADAGVPEAKAQDDAPQDGGKQDDSKQEEKPAAPATDGKADGDAPDGEKPAPIASKSGGYTIPYEKLTEARSQRDTYKAESEALKAKLAEVLAQQSAAPQADAPDDAQEQPLDKSVFKDFTEEGIAEGVHKLVMQRLERALAPIQQQQAQQAQVSAAQAHLNAIYAAHADADEVAESAEFHRWVDAQPGYAKAAILQTLQGGSAQDVIEVFSGFKAAQQPKVEPPTQPVRAAPVKAEAQAVPVSLSALPGAPAAGASDAERVQALAGNPAALLDFMAGLSPEKQAQLMNSVV